MNKYVYRMIGLSLIMITAGLLLISPDSNEKKINTTSLTRSLHSDVVNTVSIKKEIERKKIEAKKKKEAKKIQMRKATENVKLESKKVNAATLRSGSGKVSYYSLNCSGCSGRVGAGKSLRGVYYNDSKFGYVRALAGGKEYPYGSIIRISGTPLGTFTGIVLDRGGAIGQGRRYIFDVLVSSNREAYKYGISKISYQVLRYGY